MPNKVFKVIPQITCSIADIFVCKDYPLCLSCDTPLCFDQNYIRRSPPHSTIKLSAGKIYYLFICFLNGLLTLLCFSINTKIHPCDDDEYEDGWIRGIIARQVQSLFVLEVEIYERNLCCAKKIIST